MPQVWAFMKKLQPVQTQPYPPSGGISSIFSDKALTVCSGSASATQLRVVCCSPLLDIWWSETVFSMVADIIWAEAASKVGLLPGHEKQISRTTRRNTEITFHGNVTQNEEGKWNSPENGVVITYVPCTLRIVLMSKGKGCVMISNPNCSEEWRLRRSAAAERMPRHGSGKYCKTATVGTKKWFGCLVGSVKGRGILLAAVFDGWHAVQLVTYCVVAQ